MFYESAEDAERLFSIKESGVVGLRNELYGLKDTVVFDLGTSEENDPDFAKIAGCIA